MVHASTFTHHYDKSVFKMELDLSKDFRVWINGEEVPVYACHISRYPFNTVWPRHQRSFDQYEEAGVVNLVSDETVHVEVQVLTPGGKVRVKPYSKGIAVREENGRYAFDLTENGQFVLQAGSYHKNLYLLNGKPIPCEKPEEVTHYFGPGIHFPGKITLHSNESVYLDKDAYVFGCIFAEDAENLRIYGNGILDDSNEGRVSIHCYEAYTNGNVKFYDCKNVRIEGVGMTNSAIWCVNFFGCFDCVLDGVSVFGQWRYNTDGVDIVNCQRVTVKNSLIHSFDDTITIKGIDRYFTIDCTDILVDNCVLWCDWGRTCEVGIETACREYRNITFRNCDVLRGGNVVCDIQNGDEAEVHHILFEDIRAEYNEFDTPSQYQENDDETYRYAHDQCVPLLLSVNNRLFRNKENNDLWGIPEERCEMDLTGIQVGSVHDVTFRNLAVYYDDGLYRVDGKPDVRGSIRQMRDAEFYAITVENITVNGEMFELEIEE